MTREQDRAESRDEQKSLMHVKYLYMGASHAWSSYHTDGHGTEQRLRADKFTSTNHANVAGARTHSATYLAFKGPWRKKRVEEKDRAWKHKMVVVVVVVIGRGLGGEVFIRGVYAQSALWECSGFVKVACVRVTMCNSLCTSGH